MSRPTIYELLFDDENSEKMSRNHVNPEQVAQILGNESAIVPNRKGRRGDYLLVGRDDGGACISAPIEPTQDPEKWRPVTAWPSKKSERRLLD